MWQTKHAELKDNYTVKQETVEIHIIRMVQLVRFQMYANDCTHSITLWLANQDRIQISCCGAYFYNRKGTVIQELSASDLAMLININIPAYEKLVSYYNDVRLGKQIFFKPVQEEEKIIVMPKRTFIDKVAAIFI